MKTGFTSVACAAALVFACAGCGDDDTDSADAGTITATLKDFDIDLGTDSVPAGQVTFDIQNDGPSTHEFVVVRTDDDADALPTADGDVDEEQVEAIDEVEDIEAEANPSLSIDLEPGQYVVFCNLPGHYKQGMSASFTVS